MSGFVRFYCSFLGVRDVRQVEQVAEQLGQLRSGLVERGHCLGRNCRRSSARCACQLSKCIFAVRAVTCSRVIYNVIEIFHKLHAPTTCARVRNGGMLYLIDRRCVALQQQKKPL